MSGGWGVALALVAAQAGHAQDADDDGKYNFFSQPGATRAQALADYDECRELASAVQPPPAGYMYAPNPIAAGVNGLFQGFQRAAQRRHLGDAAMRKCMGVKGYGRYAFGKDDAKALYAGDWATMREKLADRAIAPVGDARRLDP